MVIELTTAQEAELAALAKDRQQTVLEYAQWVFSDYLQAQAEHRAAVERARTQIERGETIAHEEVFAQLTQRMGW